MTKVGRSLTMAKHVVMAAKVDEAMPINGLIFFEVTRVR